MEKEALQEELSEIERQIENLEVIRPLEIGLERLPEGVVAQNFIQYLPVRSVKPQKYKADNIPSNPIFGDHAVLSRDVMEIEFKQHSGFYKNLVEKKLGKKVIEIGGKRPEEEFIPWHIVEEPEHDTAFSEYKMESSEVKMEVNECDSNFSRVLSEKSKSQISGLDKLLSKIDYLTFYSSDENKSDSEESDD